jgi:hypothetical protein
MREVESDPAQPSRAMRVSTVLGASAAVALVAAVLFFVLRQHTWHVIDGPGLLAAAIEGQTAHVYHRLFMPALSGWLAVTSGLDVSPYERALAFDALCGAGACGLSVLVASRLGLRLLDAALVGLVVATCPGVVFFSTVVEVPAFALLLGTIGLWGMVELVRRPSVATWCAALLALVFAALGHPTAVLLGGLLPALWWIGRDVSGIVESSRRFRPALASFAALGVAVLVTTRVLPMLLVALGLTPASPPFALADYLAQRFAEMDPSPRRTGALLLSEFALPLAPALALLLCVALPRTGSTRTGSKGQARTPTTAESEPNAPGHPSRACLAWLAAYAVAMLAVTQLLLADHAEYGAYTLALALPITAAGTAAFARRRWLRIAVPLLGLAASTALVAVHDDPAPGRAFVTGVHEVSGELEPVLLTAEATEVGAWLIEEVETRADLYRMHHAATLVFLPPDRLRATLGQVEAFLDGACVLVSDGTLTRLRAAAGGKPLLLHADPDVWSPPTVSTDVLLDWLERTCALQAVEAAGFRGYRVTRR